MTDTPPLDEGQSFLVLEQTPENARRLLDAAEQAGHSQTVVRTSFGGFIVPSDVVDIIYPHEPAEEGTP